MMLQPVAQRRIINDLIEMAAAAPSSDDCPPWSVREDSVHQPLHRLKGSRVLGGPKKVRFDERMPASDDTESQASTTSSEIATSSEIDSVSGRT